MSLQEAELIRALAGIGWPGTGQLIEGGWQMVVPTVIDVDQREYAPFPVIVSHIGAIMRKLDGTWPKPRIRVRVKGRYVDWRTYPLELKEGGKWRRRAVPLADVLAGAHPLWLERVCPPLA